MSHIVQFDVSGEDGIARALVDITVGPPGYSTSVRMTLEDAEVVLTEMTIAVERARKNEDLRHARKKREIEQGLR